MVIFMEVSEYPLVSVICTGFNHEDYIEQALNSVLAQNYPKLEFILVDNGSTDKTKEIMEKWSFENRSKIPVKIIFRLDPLPYCVSFNDAFRLSKGKYFIDFSGDDAMLPDHIRNSVSTLANNPEAVICFSDAYLKKPGAQLKTFYQRDRKGELQDPVIQGNVYEKIVSKHIILSVTMVVRSDSFKSIGMYDESLSYEDFDIMVRLARDHPFVYSDHIGVVKNIHSRSLSAGQYRAKNSILLPSTLKVCHKIKEMNRSKDEDNALKDRVMYELKHALFSANFEVAEGFLDLAKVLGASGLRFWLFNFWGRRKWDMSNLYTKLKRE
ncbi:glycosyltransferase family 2 protein [Cyclobacteriaceae bacterium YHN15]|nr:glycosyltransferase family 2 protein [Cyclobacteriaceae bacterium YHN15]